MRLRPLTYRKVAKRLEQLGFKKIRQKGSHVFFRHQDGRTAIVPNHPGEDIGKGVLRKIIRDLGISVEEFYE